MLFELGCPQRLRHATPIVRDPITSTFSLALTPRRRDLQCINLHSSESLDGCVDHVETMIAINFWLAEYVVQV
jgi:hypothetical protein